jgi:hypothetical protein
LTATHPRISVTRQTTQLGIKGNPSWVLEQPNTEFVVRLDSDDELESDFVTTLVEALSARPTAGYAHAACTEMDSEGAAGRRRFLSRTSIYRDADNALKANTWNYRVTSNTIFFRRSAIADVGYYDADFSFAEDWDLAVRMAAAGWGDVYVPRSLSKYRVWRNEERDSRLRVEIDGCAKIFNESLAQAYRERGWSMMRLELSRGRRAINFYRTVRLRRLPATELSLLTDDCRTLAGPGIGGLLLRIATVPGMLGCFLLAEQAKRLRPARLRLSFKKNAA